MASVRVERLFDLLPLVPSVEFLHLNSKAFPLSLRVLVQPLFNLGRKPLFSTVHYPANLESFLFDSLDGPNQSSLLVIDSEIEPSSSRTAIGPLYGRTRHSYLKSDVVPLI